MVGIGMGHLVVLPVPAPADREIRQSRASDPPSPLTNPDLVMSIHPQFSTEDARHIGEQLGIDWSQFDVEQFRMGLNVELEHGSHDATTDVTGNDPLLTGKIALAHLNEFPDYYTRLKAMEEEAERVHHA